MKKRLILLGLGLAVVGTGMVINKLRKRNNEEVNEVEETVEENNEVEEMVEMVKETEENKEEKIEDELAIDIDINKFDLNKIMNFVETHKEKILKGTLSIALACILVKYSRHILWLGCFVALVVAIYGTIDGFLKGMRKEEN